MVIEWLAKLEVFTVLFRKAIVTIKLKISFLSTDSIFISPDKLLNGMIKVKSVASRSSAFNLVLNLFDKVFVADLGKSATLISIKVDVFTEDFTFSISSNIISSSPLKLKLDFMVLKSNQRKSKTRVATEPELKRNLN